METLDQFKDILRKRMEGRSLTGTAIAMGLPRDAIRSVLTGHDPKLSRVIEISKALGLKFYLKQESREEENTQKMLQEILSRLPEKKKNKISETAATYTAHHIPVYEVNAAAGAGALNEHEQVISYVAFRPDWLKKHGLQPDQCGIIRVSGDSMEPTLLDQSAVLVDRNRQRRHTGRIYVVRTEDGLLVKRLNKDKKGNWQLVSDNPEWDNIPLPTNAEIIGEVKWSGKTFV